MVCVIGGIMGARLPGGREEIAGLHNGENSDRLGGWIQTPSRLSEENLLPQLLSTARVPILFTALAEACGCHSVTGVRAKATLPVALRHSSHSSEVAPFLFTPALTILF